MMSTLLYSHIGLAYISLVLLLTRGVLSARRVDWRQYKLLKIAPHAVDTLLLGTGIGISVYWLLQGFVTLDQLIWLLPKLLFIGLYVLFSVRAFRKNTPFSLKNFILSVVSFMCVMLLAASH